MPSRDKLKLYTTDRDIPVSTLRQQRRPIYLILDNLRSAFNVGAAFRTADAVRLHKLYLCGITPSPPNHKLAKTALGTIDVVSWEALPHTLTALELLRAQGVTIGAVEVTNQSINFWDYVFPQPIALVFGNEVFGVGRDILQEADVLLQIPMAGRKNSINVATALGIVLYEVLRQWRVQQLLKM